MLSDLERSSAIRLQAVWPRSRRQHILPLSTVQRGIWFAQQINPASAAYNIGEYIEIHGPISPVVFEQALRRVVIEAEALHLRFSTDAGLATQRMGSLSQWSVPIIDVSGERDARAVAEAWMQADLARPIDVSQTPLFRFALFKASADRFYWYACYHHIVMDGFSMWLLARRVAHVYTHLYRSACSPGDDFNSVAVLLQQDSDYRNSQNYLSDHEFWRSYLADPPEPIRLGSELQLKSKGSLRHSAHLPRSTTDQLRLIAQDAGTSFAQIVSAATAVFLHRLSGRTDVVFGLPLANRKQVYRAIPGMTSNVLPVRLTIRPDMTFLEVIESTKRQIKRARKHQRYPISELRLENFLGPGRGTVFGVSVNIMRFDYEFSFAGNAITAHNLSLGPVEDLSIALYERSSNAPVRVDFDANPAFHTSSALHEYQLRFFKLLAACSAPERPLGTLDILEACERELILRTWNDTAHALPRTNVVELFGRGRAVRPMRLRWYSRMRS